MADYSTYLTVDDAGESGDDHHRAATFMHEQHAIYNSCTNYFGVQTATPAESLRVVESLQRKNAPAAPKPGKSSLTERTPLLKASSSVSAKNARTTSSVDSVYESASKKTHKVDLWFAMYLLFYVFYLVLGSVAFTYMEVESEIAERESFREVRHRFLQKHSDVLDAELEDFIREVVKVHGHGVSALHNATSELNWGFGQALFFSSTVITTIGYGHVTPLTQSGKLFCIIYATVGIPLTLVLLSAVVERLLVPTAWLLGQLNCRLGHIYQAFNIRLLHLAIIVTIFATIFLALPTLVFKHLEPSWTSMDAFYYCFISLTTIGLGDFIPGDAAEQDNRSLYKVFVTAYLLVGLVFVMLCLTVFYDIPQLNLGQLFSDAAPESEEVRLSLGGVPPCYSGPSGLYIPQRDDEIRRSVVRIRPRGDESPSPDEEQPPKDIRVP